MARIFTSAALFAALLGCGTSQGGPPDGGVAPVPCLVTAPTACPDPPPRYADVTPIFERHCVECHSGTPNGPWPLTQYSHVSDWQHEVRSDLLDCSMPPPDAGVMPLEERLTLLTWLRCGLPK